MGADFMFHIQEIKHPKEVALERVEKLALSEAHLARFEDVGVFVSNDDENVTEALRGRLREAVEAVYSAPQGREGGFFTIDGNREFVITGGVSWGEEPSSIWDDFSLVVEYSRELME